jgi:predicted ribosomally synthesized peptide with SipW-like signal peptide
MGLAAAVAVAAVGVGTTLAVFTAQAGPSGNQVTAGTVQIEATRDNGDTVPGPMFYIGPGGGLYGTGLWAPGDEVERVLDVENVGSLDAWLTGVTAQLEAGDMTLANLLQVKVTTDPAGTNVVASGTLGAFLASMQAFTPPLSHDVGDVQQLHFFVELPLSAGNSYQGQSVQVGFTVHAEQKAHNP